MIKRQDETPKAEYSTKNKRPQELDLMRHELEWRHPFEFVLINGDIMYGNDAAQVIKTEMEIIQKPWLRRVLKKKEKKFIRIAKTVVEKEWIKYDRREKMKDKFKRCILIDWVLTLSLILVIAFAAILWMSPKINVSGDVDGNGEVDIIDYSLVKLYINDGAGLNYMQHHRADIDRDGDVDETDYACIREIILGGE